MSCLLALVSADCSQALIHSPVIQGGMQWYERLEGANRRVNIGMSGSVFQR